MKIGDTIKIKGYRYLPHTADVKFVAFGKSMEKAFDNSAMALFDTIAEVKELERRDEKVYILKLKANSDDIKDLLWKMLQRCLSVSDSKGLFCYKCSSKITIKNKKYFLNYVVSCRKKNV
ncbi:archease, partial [Candidatus Marsarchaeota archaeon]|nr:archease [Candidatus Marsarchaeota archaeon]